MKPVLTKEKAYWWLVFCVAARSSLLFFIYKGLGVLYLSSLSGIVFAALMLAPVLIITLRNYKYADSELLFVAFLLSFQMILLVEGEFHPDYIEYFRRPVYGIYEVFFSTSRGAIWAFLAFSGIKNGKKVLNAFHVAAVVELLHGLYQLCEARSIGYWEVHDAVGEMIQVNYDLTFGYKLIFCCIVFLFFFLHQKRIFNLIASILSGLMVITDGSRGPILCLAVFLFLYMLVKIRDQQRWKKTIFAFLGIGICCIGLLLWQSIIPWLINKVSHMNVNSRTISMLVSGNIRSDTSRSAIYNLCLDIIRRQGPFGVGPFGDRVFIAPRYYWGYPHNVVLELILDYGWIVAIVIMAAIAVGILKLFKSLREEELIVFSILLACSTKLFISSTYWAEAFFWGMLAWMINMLRMIKGGRKRSIPLPSLESRKP